MIMGQSSFQRWQYDWAFRDERPDYDPEALLYSGYDMEDAFRAGKADDHSAEEWDRLEKKVASLEALLAANVRVMKAEIKKEMEAE